MNKETMLIIASIIASPFIGILITSIFNKKKTGAEANNLTISGEISIGEMGMKMAKTMEADLEKLRGRFDDLEGKFNVLRTEKEALAVETKEKDKKIAVLERRIDDLEAEILKYKGMGDHITEVIHTKVDEIKAELPK